MTDALDVWVIGEALVDVITTAEGTTEAVGGSPANVATGLARLGSSVALLTALGGDEHGVRVAEHLHNGGVRLVPAPFRLASTSNTVATIGPDGAASYSFSIAWDLPQNVTPPRARAVHTGSIAAFLQPGAQRLLDLLDSLDPDVRVTFDPNIRPALMPSPDDGREAFERISRRAHLVKLSDEDAAWLYPGESLDAVLDRVLFLGPSIAVGTRGARGSVLCAPGERVRIPAAPTTVVDTVGAGDSYMANLVHQLATHAGDSVDLGDIGRQAAVAAAITVAHRGAVFPSADEVSAQGVMRA